MKVLLEKLAVAHLVNKFSAIYGNLNLISVFTGSRKTKTEALRNTLQLLGLLYSDTSANENNSFRDHIR